MTSFHMEYKRKTVKHLKNENEQKIERNGEGEEVQCDDNNKTVPITQTFSLQNGKSS